MCGLLVEFSKAGQFAPNFRQRLDEMAHRGVDQISVHDYPTCRVGFRRLAITDVSKAQPANHRGCEVFLNGEIYNYKELGYGGSECEVLAQGFWQHGANFVKRLDGMFVIVVVMGAEVYVFTDRWKQKPFYWFETPNAIVLASECKPLLKHPEYHFAVNENAKAQLLTFSNIFTDETLFKGIHRLEGGVIWHLNGGKKQKYWQWSFTPEPMQYEEAKREVRRLVGQSVAMQTPKEVSYGACLSGGVDSSIIVALSGDIPTFTVGYKGQEDERPLAELMGRQHRVIVFDQVRNLGETIKSLETPLLGASWMHVGLYHLASKYVKCLFDGAGGDEIFFGYQWRYDAKDYYSVLNRTGIDCEYCRWIYSQVFPEDTPEARYIFDAEHFLGGVLSVVDKLSMAQTIEVRCPMLENDLVDFVTKIPFEYKTNKQILRDAFSDLLPPEILNAPKRGFTTPKNWITGEHNQARNWIEKSLNIWDELFILA